MKKRSSVTTSNNKFCKYRTHLKPIKVFDYENSWLTSLKQKLDQVQMSLYQYSDIKLRQLSLILGSCV